MADNVAQTSRRNDDRKVYIPWVVLIVVAAVLQASAVGTDYWFTLKVNSQWIEVASGRAGLWSVSICGEKGCGNYRILNTDMWVTYVQVMECIGLTSIVFAGSLLIVDLFCCKTRRLVFVRGVIAMVAGIAILNGAIRYIYVTKYAPTIETFSVQSTPHVSFGLAIVSSILCIIFGIAQFYLRRNGPLDVVRHGMQMNMPNNFSQVPLYTANQTGQYNQQAVQFEPLPTALPIRQLLPRNDQQQTRMNGNDRVVQNVDI